MTCPLPPPFRMEGVMQLSRGRSAGVVVLRLLDLLPPAGVCQPVSHGMLPRSTPGRMLAAKAHEEPPDGWALLHSSPCGI